MMVPFTTTCDAPECGVRAAEYNRHPHCAICMGDFCPQHIARLVEDADIHTGGVDRVLCVPCFVEEQAAPIEMRECPVTRPYVAEVR
jgi:hypothetical protein